MPTDAAAPDGPHLKIADLAARYGCSPEFFRKEIISGRLAAIDVSRPDVSRACYRIRPSDAAAWEAGRTFTPAEKPIPRRRRKPSGKQYV